MQANIRDITNNIVDNKVKDKDFNNKFDSKD